MLVVLEGTCSYSRVLGNHPTTLTYPIISLRITTVYLELTPYVIIWIVWVLSFSYFPYCPEAFNGILRWVQT
jgi:hypothetical protein